MLLCATRILMAQPAEAGVTDAGATAAARELPSAEPVDESTLFLDGTPNSEGGPSINVSPFGIWDLLRMLLVLAAVIGVVYGIFFLLKRGAKGKFIQNGSIRLLGSQSLPGNRSMYLVEVGSQVFLIGAGGDSVNLISEITDKETVDAMILAGESGTNGTKKSFGEMITGMFKGGDNQSLRFMREQKERLQQLRQR